jgi:sigma-B regulation protein RsbU (phosphoserine phosphatase)
MSDRDISILVVDDAKFSSAVVGRTLKSAGYTDIRHASSASSALEQLEERAAAILIADWLMPEMDGLELTRRVRQLDESTNRYTYVVLLTAREGVAALKTAFDEGVDDFVNKSSMNDQLIPRVMAAERITRIHNRALVENQRLIDANARLRKQTTVDPLTGYGNRQYCIKRLDDALRQARQRGGVACLLMLRIEHYGNLESRHGKSLVQQLVLAFSRRLRQLVRPMDVLARIAPDQFCLITHQPDFDHATPGSFRRLYDGLNHRAYKTAGGFLQLSVSVSLACAGEKDEIDAELMLNRTLRGLDQSHQGKRIVEQPLSG